MKAKTHLGFRFFYIHPSQFLRYQIRLIFFHYFLKY